MNLKTEYWIIDKASLENIQKLNRFVDFVSGLEQTSSEHKKKATELKYLIENLDKPETFKEWLVCLDIFDESRQYRYIKDAGIYWMKWWVFFEMGKLEIQIESESIDNEGFSDEESFFYSFINFKKEIEHERFFGDTNLDKFVEHALNFKNHLTKDLNYIETEIDIWKSKK